MSTPLIGLSAIQGNRATINAGGNSSTLNSSSVPISLPPSDQNNNPEQRYRLYGNNSGLQMLTFPPDYPEFRMVLIAKNYTAGATGVTFMPNTQGTAVNGYVLPVPQMRLGDRYNLQYDDNFAFLNMLRGNRAFNAIDTVGKITGFNINKFKTVLFEAPALKRHEFIWKFSPKNMAEATTINNIVKRLKVDSAPPTLGNSGSAVFQYPHIFDIYFDPNFREMYGFKPSVIESIDVDYSAGNPHPSFYKDGFPESVTLNISFLEIEVWNRQDYTNWNSTNDPTRTITGENQNG